MSPPTATLVAPPVNEPKPAQTPKADDGRPVPAAWYGLLALVIVVSFFTGIHDLPLFDLDEGAYAEATREMFERGNFLATYLNGQPRYDKPILFYWLQAASVSMLGWNELALRLPSALGGTAWALATALFVGRLRGARQGCLAGILVSSSWLVAMIGRAAIPDAVLNFFICASMFSIYLYHHEGHRRYLTLAFAFMGLGFLTKGPIAVLIPFVVSLVFFASTGDLRRWIGAITDGRGWAIFLVIALPWYLAIMVVEGPGFLQGFFLTHNLGRFTQAMEGHGGSPFYYLGVLLVGTVPYTGLLATVVRHGGAVLRDPLERYLAIWFVFVLAFFSLSGTKLPHYLNYGLTGLLILFALHADRLRSRGLALAPTGVFFVVLLFLPEIIGHALPDVRQAFYRAGLEGYRDYLGPTYRLACLLGLAMTVALGLAPRMRNIGRLIAAAIMIQATMSLVLMPAIGELLQAPTREAGRIVHERGLAPVVRWRLNMPSFSVYSRRVVPERRPRSGDIVYTTPAYIEAGWRYETIYRAGGVILIRLLDAGETSGTSAAGTAPAPPGQ